MKKQFTLSIMAAGLILGASASAPMAAEQTFVTIGTGGVTGTYYPTGGAICRLVNKGRKEHGIRCSVESTGGSAYNVNAVRSGELDMGIAQSDVHFNAMNGLTEKFEANGPDADLRAMFSTTSEPAQIFARTDAGISSLDSLKGKRFNKGEPGSGTVASWDVWSKAVGLSDADLAMAGELKSAEIAQATCDNKLDAMYMHAAVPSGFAKEVSTTCDVVLVPANGPKVEQMLKDFPFYSKEVIPGGTYKGSPDDTETFGVKATFVTSAKVPDQVVYQVVKAVFDNFDTFKKLHPAFKTLNEANMIKDGLSAPLHNGAVKYYKERGWM